MLDRRERIHFVGIGGAGMAPMAEIMLRMGYAISGSDREKSATSEQLEGLGIAIQYGHDPHLVKDADIVVYSSAISQINPELTYANDHGIRIMKRAAMLGDLMRTKFCVAVSGTHGKTTTTSMIGKIMHDLGRDPTVLIGGHAKDFGSNARAGSGDTMVVEADEYDRSFLRMHPTVAVITNIEADHLDIYKDLDDIKAAFAEFADKVPFYGTVVACIDDGNVRFLATKLSARVVTCGLAEAADYRAVNVACVKGCVSFDVINKGESLGRVELKVPGIHNVKNAIAAVAAACETGADFADVAKSLAKFSGVKRRFELAGVKNGITVIDDYAHHPSEIAATLSAARDCKFERVVAVFQPHLYSRTRDFLADFADVLSRADEVVVCEVYAARENPIDGVSGLSIIDMMRKSGHKSCRFIEAVKDVPEALVPSLSSGDCVLFMGAGDIWKQAERLLERIGQ